LFTPVFVICDLAFRSTLTPDPLDENQPNDTDQKQPTVGMQVFVRERLVSYSIPSRTVCDYVPNKHKSFPSPTRNEIKIYRRTARRI